VKARMKLPSRGPGRRNCGPRRPKPPSPPLSALEQILQSRSVEPGGLS
jgi:hypothetical protein